jgi:hypothetical protein
MKYFFLSKIEWLSKFDYFAFSLKQRSGRRQLTLSSAEPQCGNNILKAQM